MRRPNPPKEQSFLDKINYSLVEVTSLTLGNEVTAGNTSVEKLAGLQTIYWWSEAERKPY